MARGSELLWGTGSHTYWPWILEDNVIHGYTVTVRRVEQKNNVSCLQTDPAAEQCINTWVHEICSSYPNEHLFIFCRETRAWSELVEVAAAQPKMDNEARIFIAAQGLGSKLGDAYK